MIKTHERKAALRKRRRLRTKKKFDRYDAKLRLVVHRSARHLSGQIINDLEGKTLVSVSSAEKALRTEVAKAANKTEAAKALGGILGERAKEKKIGKVFFDRNGYLYHGRVKAFADGAREGGLTF